MCLNFVSTNNGELDKYIMFMPKELLKHDKPLIGKFAAYQRNGK